MPTVIASHIAARKSSTPEEMFEIWTQFKADQDNQYLRNRLVEQYLPLVKYNAERIWARLPDGVDLDDLISAGVFGLMDAIDAFDLTRGVKFETYCVPRIRGAMLDELRTMDWVPRLVRSKASKLEEASKTLEAAARPPADRERARRAHGHAASPELEKMITDANAVNLISLNKKWYETDSYKDVREIDILEDKKGEDPTHRIQKRDLMRLVTKGLNRNERLIIILYYYEEMTMKEIGATLDLRESRVSQMHSASCSGCRTSSARGGRSSGPSRVSRQCVGVTLSAAVRRWIRPRPRGALGDCESRAKVDSSRSDRADRRKRMMDRGALARIPAPCERPPADLRLNQPRVEFLRPGLPIVAAKLVHRLRAVVPVIGIALGAVGRAGCDVVRRVADFRRMREQLVGGRPEPLVARRTAKVELHGESDRGRHGV